MREEAGLCPSCHGEGPVGSPCPGKACENRGIHFLPAESARKAMALPPGKADPRLGQRVGEYLLADVLGRGGFGKVFLALQLPIRMRTALKLMDGSAVEPDLADAMARKFEGEAAALAALTHPNIVRLLKYGVHEGTPFLVMEYVEGGRTLKGELQSGGLAGSPDPAVVGHVLRQVLNALEAAHQQGIVHRDVKPENVMFQEVSGDPWFVKVLDFGLAKFVHEGTDTSLLAGTPAYLAPEQLARRNLGPWTDLYAAGVLAFRMLTGRLPFPGDSFPETYGKKLDPGYDPCCEAADLALPAPVQSFLRTAMASEAERRYRTAAEFRRGLDEALAALGASPASSPGLPAAGSPATAPAAAAPARDGSPGALAREQEAARRADAAMAGMASDSLATPMTRPDAGAWPPNRPMIPDHWTAAKPPPPPPAPAAPAPQDEKAPPGAWWRQLGIWIPVLAGVAAGAYLAVHGPTLDPLKDWAARAERFLSQEGPVVTTPGSPATAPALPPDARVAPVHLSSRPSGARVFNDQTGDALGTTPLDVLVPPGGSLSLRLSLPGRADERLTLTHAEALQSPERTVDLSRRR